MKPISIDPLSYSSSNEILSCPQKYVYRKVQKVERDPDAPMDTLALDIGKALHGVCELAMHNLEDLSLEVVTEQMAKYDLSLEWRPMLVAMLRKYRELHRASGLECPHVEVPIRDDDFIGFVDAIMADQEGWWIVDLKTASSVSRFLPSRLHRDRQLNIYAAKLKAESIGLDPDKFKGCRYRVVTKSKLRRRKDESEKAYSLRMEAGIEAREYIIPKEAMDPASAVQQFKLARMLQEVLWQKGAEPLRNYQNCDSYFRPCEYWSRCHGSCYSDEPKVTEVIV